MIGKKRFWFLGLAVVTVIIISFLYVAIIGDSYDVHSRIFFSDEAEYKISAEFSEEGVVEYIGSSREDGEIIFKLKSIKRGKTDIRFSVSSKGGDLTQKTKIYVNAVGTIFERSETMFSFSGYKAVIAQIMTVLILILIVMIYSFLDMRRKAYYSYAMIAAGGVALYIAILIAFLFYKMLNHVVTSFSIFLSLISETGIQFLIVMTPFMLALAVALSVSNIWLLHNEGYRPVNALGIAFSAVWIIGMAVSFSFMFTRVLNIENYEIADGLNKAFIYLCCYFECMLVSTVVCANSASRHKPPYDRDCIIILGCAIRADGTPTPLLRMRAESALRFEREQYQATGKHALLVPSGGQGNDEVISEAESMRRYLTQQGAGEEQIAPEDKSTSTYENMRFSREVIESRCGDITQKKIAFATTNYHVFRGYILARKNGFEAQGISAKTKWYFFPNAFLREFVGLLADRKIMHITLFLLITAFFITVGRLI